jgi:hypothetical protein
MIVVLRVGATARMPWTESRRQADPEDWAF